MNIWDDDNLVEYVTLRHFDPDVEAVWSLDQEGDDSLQIVYERKGFAGKPDEKFWLYLSPHTAEVIGKLLVAWGQARS